MPDEPLDDWADRVVTLATKAFRELPEDYMYKQAVLRFCHGCADKEAGEQVANCRPVSMEDAIDRVKWAIHTHNAVHGRSRREVRLVSSPEEYSICATKPKVSIEGRLEGLEKKVEGMDAKFDRIMSVLDGLSKKFSRSRSPSPAQSKGQVQCFRCKGSHYVRDCPQPKPEKEEKKVQFVENLGKSDPLNEEGSGEEA
jgi:hypothetical protein